MVTVLGQYTRRYLFIFYIYYNPRPTECFCCILNIGQFCVYPHVDKL